MNNQLYVFSFATGEVYPIPDSNIKTLFSYQVPLTGKPKSSCRHCYGRGYFSINSDNKVYNMCRCTVKQILPGFDIETVKIYTPKWQESVNNISENIYTPS